jgi:outer membrane receptor protein involved in Fe transport
VTTTYLDQYDYAPVAGAKTLDAAGTDYPSGALPHWRGLGYAEYSKGPWTGSYQVQYVGTMEECGQDDGDPDTWDGCRTIDDRWYQDVRVQYKFARGPTLSLAIENLAGTDPPRVNFNPSGANTDQTSYDLLGRTYFVSLSYRIE